VPMEVIAREHAVEVAREFCSRHLPELSGEGDRHAGSQQRNPLARAHPRGPRRWIGTANRV